MSGPDADHPTAAALPEAAAIAQALRPLTQYLPARLDDTLDEIATAERAAQDQLWLPVPAPAPDRRWDAAVVIDDYLSMTLWRDTVAAFVDLLRRHRAFRDVIVRRLGTDAAEPTGVTLRGADRGAPVSGPVSLLAGARHRLVFIITDGAGPAWRAGAVLPLLRAWASRLPVVIVNLLPQRQWDRTGIRAWRLRMRAPNPGAANARTQWEARDAAPDMLDDAGLPLGRAAIPVPVLELRSGWLAVWARFVTGSQARWANLPAILVTPWASPPRDGSPPATGPLTARQRVRDFAARATSTAMTLASCLAAAPLNLPLMRMLRKELVPDADNSHLAEILTSGLLRPVVATEELDDRRRVTLEFEPGVREELLAAGRRTDTIRVVQTVAARFGEAMPSLRELSRVVADPESASPPRVTAETVPFIRVGQAVLQALSGRYLSRSRQLGDALADLATTAPMPGETRATAEGDRDVTIEPTITDHSRHPADRGGAGVSSSTAEDAVSTGAATPPTRTPVIWGNVPIRNPNFTGRTELLEHLHEQMQRGMTAVLPHALHGMGGVGKSQLAVEYIYLHQGEYELVWWIPAERPAQIGASMVELAQRMKLPIGEGVAAAVPAVREALRVGRPYANWLLVFDNAESPEAVRAYFPPGGPGNIMVTSRNPQWSSVARTLEVNVFTRAESIQLLRRRAPELDDGAADRLAEALGDLPLALEQAAAWRAETGMTADEYLRLFDEKRTELLEVSAPMDYQIPVAAAWNVSLDRLVVSNPAAFRLLQLCSFFAPEPIPRTLLGGAPSIDIHPELSGALRDPMRLNRAIREVNRYALAKIDHRTNSIQMHRLIQAVLIDRMSASEQRSMRRSAHLLLASSDRNDPTSPANWRTYAELYPHLMASEAFRSTDRWVLQLVENEARYLYWWGDHKAAHELSRRAYDARLEQLGADDLATLSVGRWLGFMLFVLGRFREAAEFNEQLLAAHQRAIAEDNEELLAAVGAVAADRRVAGDYAGALEIDQDLYARHVRALGEEDPATLNAAHNLAVSLRLTGRLTDALQIDEETWAARARLLGQDHTDTVESELNLVTDRRELGGYLEARTHQQQIVDRLRQMLSPGHVQTLRAMRRLASALRKAGDHEAARQVSAEVLEASIRQGEDHPDTILATLSLAMDLRATGDLETAIQHFEQVKQRYQQLLGEGHPLTIAAALNGAIAYRRNDEVARARQINESGYEALARRLGPDHPMTLACAVNLASDLYAAGDFAAAHERDTDTSERLRRVLGDEHPTTLICLGNLAMDLVALGRVAEAHELHADIVPRFQRKLGDHHPATVAGADLTIRGDCDLDPMPL